MESPIVCHRPRVFLASKNDLKSLHKSELWDSAPLEDWEVATESPASPLLFVHPHSNSHISKLDFYRPRQERSLGIPTFHSMPALYSQPSSPRTRPVWKVEAALRLVAAYCPLPTLTALMLVNRSIGRSRELKSCLRVLLSSGLQPGTRYRYWHQQAHYCPTCPFAFRPLSLCSPDIVNDTIRTPAWNTPQFPLFQQAKLTRVLDAISTSNAEIGYCQGMNYVAGVIVQVIDREEDCYLLMSALLRKHKLGNLYKAGLKKLKLRCFQLDSLVQKELPALAGHLKGVGLTAKVYAARWFLTLLSCDLPGPALLVVWDLFLYSGWKALFRVMLAMLASVEQRLLTSDAANSTYILDEIATHCGQNVIRQSFTYKVTRKRLQDLKRLKKERHRRSYQPLVRETEGNCRFHTESCLTLQTEPSEDSLARRLLRYLLPASMLEETICLDDLSKG